MVPTLFGSTGPIAVSTCRTRPAQALSRALSNARGLSRDDPRTPGNTGQRRPSTSSSEGPELIRCPRAGQPEAGKTRSTRGLSKRRAGVSDTVPVGVVADQSPSSGSAPRNSSIRLDVSKGPELVIVPDFNGLDRDDAVAQAEALGLKAEVLRPLGRGKKVHAQSPSPGTQVKKGTVVRLVVY